MRNRKSQYNTLSKDLSSAKFLQEMGKQKKKHLESLRIFFEGYLYSILDDAHSSLGLLYGSADYTRDRRTIKRRLNNEGFAFVADVLPSLMDGLLNHLEGGESTFSSKFKCRGGRPTFLRRLTEIATNGHNYKPEMQAKAMEYVYNISVCGKKYRATPDEQPVLKQWTDFLETDRSLMDIDISSSELSPVMDSVATQWYNFAHDLSIDDADCIPRPGPGATVGNIQKSRRYAPHVMYEQVDKVFPYESWFFSHPYDLVDQTRNYLNLYKEKVEEPHSEYLLVPKTYRKWRGICKEANEVQFIQQALRRLLTRAIKRRLANHLPLDDQGVHAKLALEASIDRSNATIDESEASDRIARKIVAKMTELTPELRDALMAVSTKWVLAPTGLRPRIKVRTEKFAPMGSAVCFPIMSILHLFLIRAIILIYGKDWSFTDKKRFCSKISVYGDDIVLPSACVPLVYEWLPRFGMKINQTKSFVKSFFRESCGCHAYKGVDITPVYIKYTTFSTSESCDNKKLLSLLSVESQLHDRGFEATARFVRQHIEATWGQLPYVSNVLPVVGYRRRPFDPSLTDFSLKKSRIKWNRKIQSHTFRLEVFQTEHESGSIPRECEALLRSYCLKPRRDVNLELGKGLFSSFHDMGEWIKRLDDKTIRLKKVVVPLPTSALFGHSLGNLAVPAFQ